MKSGSKFLDSIASDQDFCITSCKIGANLDVGRPLISETYLGEMKLNRVFIVSEGIESLLNMFAQGIKNFDSKGLFVKLENRATEDAALMK